MLDLGWQEFFLIAVIALLVVGPKDLPNVIRAIMQTIRKIKGMAREFQSSIEEVAREAELDEIRKKAQEMTSGDPVNQILDTVDPDREVTTTLKETREAVEAAIPSDSVNAALPEDPVIAPPRPDAAEVAEEAPKPKTRRKTPAKTTSRSKAAGAKKATTRKSPARKTAARGRASKPKTETTVEG